MDNARKIQIFWVDAISRDNASLHQRVRRVFPFDSFLFPRGVAVAAEKIHLSESDLAFNSRITSIDIAFDRDHSRKEFRYHEVLQVSENNLSYPVLKKKKEEEILYIRLNLFKS